MKFSDVIGHKQLKISLAKSIERGRVAHSQLFVGGSGRGSLALALAYVQYLFCRDKKDGDSCGICPECYKISRLEHPDLHFVFPNNKSPHAKFLTSQGNTISDSLIELFREKFLETGGYLDQQQWYSAMQLAGKNIQANIGRADALEVIKKMGMKSFEGGYKCVIIWLPEKMNDSAANTLLKLFEEPAENTLFLFVSHSKEGIIKTILSRTQQIDIAPIDGESIASYILQKRDDLAAQLPSLVRLSHGDVIELKKLLYSQEESSESFDDFTSLMRLCYGLKYVEIVDWAHTMAEKDRELQRSFFAYATDMVRDSFIKTIGMDHLSLSLVKESGFISKFHPYIHHQNVEQLVKEFEKASFDLSRNGNQKMVFVDMALSISKLIRLPK